MAEPKHVTYRDALIGLGVALTVMGGFGLWVIGEAKASGAPMQTQLDRIEQKVDGIEKFLRGDK